MNPIGCSGMPQCVSVLDQESSIANQQRINDQQSQIGQ
jgi:hypothetical protein